MHDALAVYDIYPATHASCAAHLIRELTAVAEQHRRDLADPSRHRAQFIAAAGTAREQRLARHPGTPLGPALHLFRHAVLVGLSEHRRKETKARNLLERRANPGSEGSNCLMTLSA